MRANLKKIKNNLTAFCKGTKLNRLRKAAVCGFLCVCLLSFAGFSTACGGLQRDVLRLHILANSDSPADQALKLQVRDAVLESTRTLFDNAASAFDAVSAVCTHLQTIQSIARQAVCENGYDYPVTVQIRDMYFETRDYGSFSLPAGVYRALRITIGAGAGHNWWCVIFPGVCVGACAEKSSMDAQQSFSVLCGEEEDVATHPAKYEIRWKVYELYEQARAWLRGSGGQ